MPWSRVERSRCALVDLPGGQDRVQVNVNVTCATLDQGPRSSLADGHLGDVRAASIGK
jgi:hypothetical protein